jgi:uncharacterized damage-inducible protein DinB
MEAEVQGYLTERQNLRREFRDAIKGINDEPASWHPLAKDTNSIYAIINHLIEVDRFWVTQVIQGQMYKRDREGAFRASGHFPEIMNQWEKTSEEMDTILGKLSQKQLDETRTISGRPELGSITIRWGILHLITHSATHLGHIQLTRQLWEQRSS